MSPLPNFRTATATALVAMAALSGLQSATASVSPGPSADRPNVVFVMADDLSTNLLQFMPHVTRLAVNGMSFTRYYVVDSLCCPSRTAIMTGEYPHNNGVFTNTPPDGGYGAFLANNDQHKTFAVTLQNSGYRTALMGKFLNGYRASDPPQPGWSQWVSTDSGYQEFNYTLNVNGRSEPHGSAPADYLTDVLSRKAQTFIRDSVAARKPFFLEVSTFAPHNPEVAAPRYASALSSSPAPRAGAYDRLPTNPVSWMRAIPPMDDADASYIQRKWLRRARSVLAIDDMVASLRNELTQLGVAGRTYFVFTSDNGFHLGEHRLVYGKKTAFDTDIQVPLIVAGPSVPPGRKNSQLMASVDLAPTFEDLADVSVPATVDGVSMLRQWHGQTPRTWQKAVLIEHHQGAGPTDPDAQAITPPNYTAMRSTHGLLVKYPATGETEYYDTDTDPLELHNLPRQAPAGSAAQLRALETCVGAAQCQRAAGAG